MSAPAERAAGGRRISLRLASLAGLSLLLLTGCRVDLDVDLSARANGSGEVRATVTLDKDAAAQVPELERDLRLSDLEAAGWSVDGPSRQEDGSVRVRASKSFSDPDGAGRAMSELGGPTGPFRDFRLRVDPSFVETRTTVRGTADLSGGLEAFSDEVLRQRLGSPLGVDVATVERQLGRPLTDAFRVSVAARLPGGAPTVVRPELGQRAELAASARRLNVDRIAAGGLAGVAGLALVVVLVARLVRSA